MVTLFHQRVERAYQEMIAEAPPVEDARSGVAEVKRAATVFEALAREYADCVWAFADGRPGVPRRWRTRLATTVAKDPHPGRVGQAERAPADPGGRWTGGNASASALRRCGVLGKSTHGT